MNLTAHQNKILQAIDEASATILSVSHQIHDHPELGFQEIFAANLLVETLESFGFQVERGFAAIPTAFCARKGDPGGPRLAFLAEYDALPEIGHACGHNFIAASALSAGIGLGAVAADLPGEVWVVGTPAEETDGAKVMMVARGAFNDLDAALMVHPYSNNYSVPETLALDALQVEFFGKTSHAAAAPWEGKNALDALLLLFNSINALRQQIRPDARINGIITHGGVAANIIPDYAVGRFYLRAKQRLYLNQMVENFNACVQAATVATGTRAQVSNYEGSFNEMVNNITLAQRMTDHMSRTLDAGAFMEKPDSFGSADMGDVSQVVPAIHVMIDITSGQPISPHTREFCAAAAAPFADQALLRAGKGLALTGYDFLQDPRFREAVRTEFDNQHR